MSTNLDKVKDAITDIFGLNNFGQSNIPVYSDTFGEVEEKATDETTTSTEDEWIWVEGYKATKYNMKCLDFQYEMNKQFDMPEDAKISECERGFHLCLKLKDVFSYYGLRDGHRFFAVKALVRKSDYDKYGKREGPGWSFAPLYSSSPRKDKLVSKSIIFIKELTNDEIFETYAGGVYKEWSSEDKELAKHKGVDIVLKDVRVRELISLGYSRPFAEYLNDDGVFEIAKAVGSQEDLSMDMKVAYIMRGEK